ncbi:hypothetical protein [Polynucleobacter sinensis]|uniref:hypothetical protein n=1 Tax=Polynucleobacter sinensis TaxID=1743157 RepID=UPI000785E3ED|nr:hypothetical protein [Polynucleobacter sinensis]
MAPKDKLKMPTDIHNITHLAQIALMSAFLLSGRAIVAALSTHLISTIYIREIYLVQRSPGFLSAGYLPHP